MKERDRISKINITIDYQIESFYGLFDNCKCIESINFINFHRNNVINMGFMFYGCSSLKELNLSNFNTNNVNNMRGMFNGCSDELIEKIKEQYKNLNIF